MKKILAALCLGVSLTGQAQTPTPLTEPVNQSPYSLKPGREAGLFGAGVVTYGAAYALDQSLTALTPADVGRLNTANIASFDRPATARYSPAAARLSNLTLGAGLSITGLVMLSAKAPANAAATGQLDRPAPFLKSELFTVGVMYVETMLLTNALKSAVKNAVERTRPFAYNPAAPLSEKLERDTQRSFYSGHAANAFATAVFAAEVFRHYHPHSKAKAAVWVGSLGMATATAYLRYDAGQHFPSDLLVGAAVGSLAGWGVPKLHENRAGKQRAFWRNTTVNPWSTGLASGVYIRRSFSAKNPVHKE